MTLASAVWVDASNVDKAAIRAYLQQLESGGSAGGGVFPITGGIVVSGRTTSGLGRTDAQIEIQGATGYHTLFSFYNPDPTEEAALSFQGVLDDASVTQHIGQFVRFVNSNNAVASWNSVWAIHNVGCLGQDNVPILTYSNNSVWQCAGLTSAAPWATLPPANSWSIGSGGATDAGVQMVMGIVSGWTGIGAKALTLDTTNYNILIKYEGSMNLNAPTGKSFIFANANNVIGEVTATGIRAQTGLGFYQTVWGTTASAANANVADADYIKLVTSVRAAKHDIEPISEDEARRTVMGMQGVHYRSRIDEDQRRWAGFIADDMAQLNDELATFGEDGKVQSVTYDRVPAYLVPMIQAQERRLAALERRVK